MKFLFAGAQDTLTTSLIAPRL